MSEPESIRKFEYRPSRFATGFNVDFVVAGEAFHGLCKDVSDTGIRAMFEDSLVVGSSGVLILRHPAGKLEIEAQVGYCEKCEAGFVFIFRTDWERQMTIEYVASIAKHSTVAPTTRFQ